MGYLNFLDVVIARDFAAFLSSILYFLDVDPNPENSDEYFDFQSIVSSEAVSSTHRMIFNLSIQDVLIECVIYENRKVKF